MVFRPLCHYVSFIRHYSSAPSLRRFWKEVSVLQENDHFKIKLDHHILKTPEGQHFKIPLSKPILATLLSAEWESQEAAKKAFALPLSSIIARSQDQLQYPNEREKTISTLLPFLHTDTICYQQSYPETAVKLQDEKWKPIIDWANSKFGTDIQVTTGLLSMKQSAKAENILHSYVCQFSPLKLAAFERAVIGSKSFLIGLAVVERQISVQQATEASRLETILQTKQWGSMRDVHELEEHSVAIQLGSAVACVMEDS